MLRGSSINVMLNGVIRKIESAVRTSVVEKMLLRLRKVDGTIIDFEL